jgi:nicotinamide-nucleotide amidase
MLSCNSRPRQVLVINVGDELLDGIRENTHLLWLGEHLARRGLPVTRSLVVRDDAAEIARAVGEAWAPTTSSSPPAASGRPPTTHTREAVAGALGLKLEHVPAAEKALRERFKLIGRKVAAGDLGQRHVLAGGDALPNPRGTAPGVFYHRDGKALVMLPGPALELRPMFEDEVVPRLRDVGRACQGEVSAVCRPSASAPCPSRRSSARRSSPAWCFPSARIPAVVDARISSGGSGATADELCEVARQVRDAVGEDFVATGHACPATLVEQLRSLEKTVALAESCTGGLLANSFTDIPGSSKVFARFGRLLRQRRQGQSARHPRVLIAQHGAVLRGMRGRHGHRRDREVRFRLRHLRDRLRRPRWRHRSRPGRHRLFRLCFTDRGLVPPRGHPGRPASGQAARREHRIGLHAPQAEQVPRRGSPAWA